MEVVILPSPEEVTRLAANLVARLVRETPTCVLGLPTGNTPLKVYQALVRMHREQGLDFSRVTTFNLDEYLGLEYDHPASYRRYMWEQFFGHINISQDNVHIPDSKTDNVERFCMMYEHAIAEAGGIDLQLLGLGEDGHIGFNEPTSSLASRTRLKTLTDATMHRNQTTFEKGKMPRHVITMGVGTIMESRRCVILAFGRQKAKAVAGMIEGPVTAFVPASALQLHPETIALVDEAAATDLKLQAYYRQVYRNKPTWQRYE